VSEAYLKRLRRLLLLLPVAARAATKGRGVPLSRAVELTGARDEAEVIADVTAVSDALWVAPGSSEDVIDLYVENGEVHLTYPQAFGTPPAFSLVEGAVLLTALVPFEKEGAKPVKDAIRKLRRAIPEQLRPEAERLVHGLDLVRAPPGPWAGALREAIGKRVETVVEYRAVADAAAVRRVVEPRLLLHREGQWYLAAWNVEKAQEHLFRLDRIASVELGTRVFGEHKGPPVSRYARKNLYFESGAEREVTIRFSGTSARLARERWGERASQGDDGTVTVRMKVTPGNYLFGVVMGHGGEATVEGPVDVVAKFRERLSELAALYED
jgi:proteasome accessory factor C